ncbi:MAG TPA: hypothetical protein IAC26_01765 [Candidatus Scatomorpha stercoravium]|nr:hypothetical protein [Candidatus Scatomorpha stercoravium]
MKKLTLKTKEGCWRLLIIFLALIVLFSCAARLVSSDAGKIKVSRVTFDSRGATVTADLFYPAGTTDEDKLPAVLVGHGAGVTRGIMKGIAEEIARRGYVVLNVDAYGYGMSEMPVNDDSGQDKDNFDSKLTPGGMLDALNFVRTLEFVDQTRIGMAGHSAGSRRTASAAMLDCGYLTLNDLLINVLYDDFGQEFTEEEIKMNADELAKDRLNDDQLSHYMDIKEETELWYNTRMKALCLIGSSAEKISLIQTVLVGGHEVQRNCQVNFGIVTGYWDFNYIEYPEWETTTEAWHTGSESVERETWYIIDDVNATSEKVGLINEASILTNDDFREAVDNRATRIACYHYESHSKNFFSAQTASDIVSYFEQTLGYNGGELGDSSATPLASDNIVFFWREAFNFAATLSMICFLFPLTALILKTNWFAGCQGSVKPLPAGSISKKRYWLFNGVTVILTFAAMYYVNSLFAPGLPTSAGLPLFSSWWLTVIFLAIMAVCSVILVLVYWRLDKATIGTTALENLNIKLKISSILKSILLSIILLMAAYGTLMLVEYMFGEDFRLWMMVFTEMKAELWALVWKFALMMFPSFLLIGAATNYTVRTDIPEWLDTLIAVVVNSLGVWLLCLVNYISYAGSNALFSNFTSSYGFIIFVPLTVYVTRKMYKVTNNIWIAAALNALLLSWSICSCTGYNTSLFPEQTWVGNFFNI